MWTISSEQLTKRHSQASVCRRKLPRAGIGLGALAIAMSWCVAVSANYERALEHFESGRYEDSISELQTTLAQAPDKTAARVLLGRALLATDQAAAAIAELETALSMGGDRNLIMVPLGTAFLQALKPERVLTGILPLGHDARTDGEILLLRGAAAMVYGDLGLARQVFREAEIHLPEDPRPLIGQARVALAQGKMELAHQRLELALVRDPRSSEAWTLIGTTYRDAGDFDAAERALSEALQIDPDFDKALSARAGLKLASGSGADASVDARRVLEKNPIDLEGLYIESQLLRRDGQVEAARAPASGADVQRPIADMAVLEIKVDSDRCPPRESREPPSPAPHACPPPIGPDPTPHPMCAEHARATPVPRPCAYPTRPLKSVGGCGVLPHPTTHADTHGEEAAEAAEATEATEAARDPHRI